MAERRIVHYPHPALREEAKPVTAFDAELKRLVEDMAETMYAAPGVGLAAPQVDVLQRVFVVDISSREDAPGNDLKVFINPTIVEKSGEITWEEGCLSIPGVHVEVQRAQRIRVQAFDVQGKPFELEAEDFLAVAIQHENDHLNGRLIIDFLSPLKRRTLQRKFSKRAATGTGS